MPKDEQTEWMFETADYQGNPVVLSKSTWHTKAGSETADGTHPEIIDYFEDIKLAIESPDIVFQSSRDERSRIFYKIGAGRNEFEGKHLVVIVKYVNDSGRSRGYVSTMYITRSIYSKGEQLWIRMKP
ncbi:MAG: hypothetical protein V2I97_17680 [Desulfococcaceae bacterium]|jgi:hypothetical protein|nr:hypothetical protein [Desulfococcaceae bacterium]